MKKGDQAGKISAEGREFLPRNMDEERGTNLKPRLFKILFFSSRLGLRFLGLNRLGGGAMVSSVIVMSFHVIIATIVQIMNMNTNNFII